MTAEALELGQQALRLPGAALDRQQVGEIVMQLLVPRPDVQGAPEKHFGFTVVSGAGQDEPEFAQGFDVPAVGFQGPAKGRLRLFPAPEHPHEVPQSLVRPHVRGIGADGARQGLFGPGVFPLLLVEEGREAVGLRGPRIDSQSPVQLLQGLWVPPLLAVGRGEVVVRWEEGGIEADCRQVSGNGVLPAPQPDVGVAEVAVGGGVQGIQGDGGGVLPGRLLETPFLKVGVALQVVAVPFRVRARGRWRGPVLVATGNRAGQQPPDQGTGQDAAGTQVKGLPACN